MQCNLTQFLSNRSQYEVVIGCQSKLVNMVSGVPQGSVLCPQFFPVHRGAFHHIDRLYGYADDSTLLSVVTSESDSVSVTESTNRDLNMVSICYDLWGMKLNASKTKAMMVSRSCAIHPVNPINSEWTCTHSI